MHRFAFACALALSACQSSDAPSTAQRVDPIYNGTRDPQTVALNAGQQLAIGWLHQPGFPESNFCTGTLIRPAVVATASHCTEGERPSTLAFGIGMDPSQPMTAFNVAAIHEHPHVDAALLILEQDAVAQVPELIPINVNRADLEGPFGQSLHNQEVQAGGYGETYDPSRYGRYFATVQLIDIDHTYIIVDGRGQQGICFGDSGGPVITLSAEGLPVILGVEHGGDATCVDIDELTRLDKIGGWIDRIIGPMPTPPPEPDPEPCGEINGAGHCVDNTLEFCSDGQLIRRDCLTSRQTCGYVERNFSYDCLDEVPPPTPDPEPSVPECTRSRCQGDLLIRCTEGIPIATDCDDFGQTCGLHQGHPMCLNRRVDQRPRSPSAEPSTRRIRYTGSSGCVMAERSASGEWVLFLVVGLIRRRRNQN